MKNDFREFYDEDYILHNMVDEEYLEHANGWGHKFIDKIRTKFGKWRYVYPEDVNTVYQQEQHKSSAGLVKAAKKKAFQTKVNQAKYDLGAAVSKITGKNKKFKENVVIPQKGEGIYKKRNFVNYANENKKAGAGMNAYNKKQTAARSSLDAAYAFRSRNGGTGQSDYSIVMNNQERLAKRKAKKAAANVGYKQEYANRQRKAAASAASRAQKAQIYGDYAAKQKKAVKSAASKAQKAQIYAHYDQMQKNKALGAAYRSARKQAHYDYKKKQAFYETDPAYGRNKKYKKYGTFPKWKMKK